MKTENGVKYYSVVDAKIGTSNKHNYINIHDTPACPKGYKALGFYHYHPNNTGLSGRKITLTSEEGGVHVMYTQDLSIANIGKDGDDSYKNPTTKTNLYGNDHKIWPKAIVGATSLFRSFDKDGNTIKIPRTEIVDGSTMKKEVVK